MEQVGILVLDLRKRKNKLIMVFIRKWLWIFVIGIMLSCNSSPDENKAEKPPHGAAARGVTATRSVVGRASFLLCCFCCASGLGFPRRLGVPDGAAARGV